MKYRKLKVILFFLLASKALGSVEPLVFKVTKPVEPKAPIPKLMKALVKVESRGKASAVGDHGEDYGILQVHESMVEEYNRISGRYLSHNDMFTPERAREVADVVLRFYARHIFNTTGRAATPKELAFIWNGGGEAWRRASNPRRDTKQQRLEAYWRNVSRNLEA